MRALGWRERAACRGLGHMFVMPDDINRKGSIANEFWAKARAVCQQCPVRIPCLLYALTEVPSDDCAMYSGLAPATRQREAHRYRLDLAKAAS